MGVEIHPTAAVDPQAELGVHVKVGPFAVVEAGACLGDQTRIAAHGVVLAGTRLGPRCQVHAHAVLGGAPQDLSYQGEPTRLECGHDTIFREHVTVSRGSLKEDGVTRVGSHCMLMAGAHIGHDCIVGDRVVMANYTLLAGHVRVGDQVGFGGQVAVAAKVHIGRLAYLAGGSRVEQAIPPFVMAGGDRARPRGLNRVGLQRAGIDADERMGLKALYRRLYLGPEPFHVALEAAQKAGSEGLCGELLRFLARHKQ